jgi:mRNA-degrading endonuclease toxin of MazEF toxin-antitoxin module
MARLFTIALDETIVAMISTAREGLVIVAPGLSRTVATALACRITSDDCPTELSVTLDVDPEVCRLGYGEIEALDILRLV